MTRVEFHFDFGSPNAYLSHLVIPAIEQRTGVKFDYEIAMGVRYGEREWKETVEKLIAGNKAAITAILREYNVPLVNERGEPVD